MSDRLVAAAWEADLPLHLKAVLVKMASWANDNGQGIRASQEYYAWVFGVTTRQVRRYLNDLKDAGLLDEDGFTERGFVCYRINSGRLKSIQRERKPTAGWTYATAWQSASGRTDLSGEGGHIRPGGADISVQGGRTDMSDIDRELDRELDREETEPASQNGQLVVSIEAPISKQQRDEVWDTLVDIFGPPSPNRRTLYGRTAKFIVEAGGTRDDILDRAAKMVDLWGIKTLTVNSICDHWHRWDALAGQLSNGQVEEWRRSQRRRSIVDKILQSSPT